MQLVTIQRFVEGSGSPLNPSDVYTATPGLIPGDGNLWVNVTMWE